MNSAVFQGSPSALKRVIRGLAFALIALVVVGVVIGLLLIRSSNETLDRMSTLVNAVASESTEVTNAYLDIAEAAGDMSARSFADSNADLDHVVLQSTLKNVVSANPSVDAAFVGLPNGDFLFVAKGLAPLDDGFRIRRIVTDPSRLVTEQQTDSNFHVRDEQTLSGNDYDPRSRPWYEGALERGRGWTAPYLFASSGLPGITQFIAVQDDAGNTLGVVGVDVRLHELGSFLTDRRPSENGHALIIDDQGSVIASSGQGDLDRATLTHDRLLALAATSSDLRGDQTATTAWEDDQDRTVAALARIGADQQWTLLVAAPERDFQTAFGARPDRVRLLLPLLGLLIVIGVASITVRAIRRIEKLHVGATTDPLTGILNRSEVRNRLAEVLDSQPDIDLAIVAIDLDDFGDFNDAWGHAAGDRVLLGFTSRLSDALGERGFAGRIGGDEFLVVMHIPQGADPASEVADLLTKTTFRPFVADGVQLDLGVSCGFCLRPAGELIGQLSLLRNSDLALLTAKANKPDIVQFDEDMTLPSLRDTSRHGELLAAIERGEFEFHFQPEMNLLSGHVIGAEALMRWRKDETVVAAAAFIDDLERLDLIDLLTPQLIETAVDFANQIDRVGFTMRVNLSSDQLRNGVALDAILAAHEQGPVDWCIEITERTIVESNASTRERLQQLVDRGVSLALDDFGTGYSSMAELSNMPITTIKIDRSFIETLTYETASTSLTSVLIDMADRLDLEVVAEGIETEEQLNMLIEMGCTRGQGYYYAKAMPVRDFLTTTPLALPTQSRFVTTPSLDLTVVDVSV